MTNTTETTNLLLLKIAEADAPFQYYVFLEHSLSLEIAKLYADDTKRYGRVLELAGNPYVLENIIKEVQNGNFDNSRLTVLR